MVGKIRDSFSKLPASQMLDSLIDKAIETRASFIHIEPGELEVIVRYRVNGSLVETNRFSRKRFDSFIDRVKSLANLDTRIRNIPQDGKFKISKDNDAYTFRVSIMPTIEGEKISINILNSTIEVPNLIDLGYWGDGLKAINRALTDISGLILLNGPRNSGKSLSLFSMLSNIHNPNVKIATIEDPVEYIIKNSIQTQVNHRTNLTFASGLRALEKHDNDVIMVSGLIDTESANLVFRYASQGKLILSTIYADNITNTINKLNDLGISRPLIAHVLRVIISQRLVRRLCNTCRESFQPDKALLNLIYDEFGLNDPSKMKQLHNLETEFVNESPIKNQENQLNSLKDLSTTEFRIKRLWREHIGGCDNCSHSGYSGYVGLYEVINNTPSIEKLLVSMASHNVLVNKAMSEGTISLQLDGLIKALCGQVSINKIVELQQLHI